MRRLASLVLATSLGVAACGQDPGGTPEPPSTSDPSTTAAATVSTTTTTAGTSAEQQTHATAETEIRFEDLLARMAAAPEPLAGRVEAELIATGIEGWATGHSQAFRTISWSYDRSTGAERLLVESNDPFDTSFSSNGETAADAQMTVEVRLIGDLAYVRHPLFGEWFDVETPWLSTSAENGAAAIANMGFSTDPARAVTVYEGAEVKVDVGASASVNGIDADHFVLTIDTTSWLRRLPSAERLELEVDNGVLDGRFTLNLWLAPDGRPVRFLQEIESSSLNEPESGLDAMTIQVDFFDGPVEVDPPLGSLVSPMGGLELFMFAGES